MHLSPYRKEKALSVELHFNIASPPFSERLDVEALFHRAQPVGIGGARALTLGPEDLVTHLCLHASVHHMFDNGITPFIDLAFAVEHYGNALNWPNLVAWTKEIGAERCLYLTLSIGRGLLEARVPDGVLAELAPEERGEEMIAEATEMVFDREASARPNVARLFGEGRPSEKIVHFLWRLFPSPSSMLPESSKSKARLPLLYAARIKGLWRRHGDTLRKALRGDPQASSALEFGNRRNRLRDWMSTPARS